jgi:branched-chain amino acid transport system ATP-binding protein
MLQVQSLSVRRGNVQALHEVTLHVQEGEIVSLVGSNGAGKSTLLYTIAGVLAPFAGTVVCQGRTLNGVSPERVALLGIGLVPEGRQLFGSLCVRDNLLLGSYVHHVGQWRDLLSHPRRIFAKKEVRQRLETVLELFPVLGERQKQAAGSLSGGEQQMLAIGRALMAHPKLLLMDEPSMGLAPILVEQNFEIIQQINQQGITIFMVEQNANMALSIAHRGYVLQTGRVVLADQAANLLNNEQMRKAYLGR